MVPLLPFFYLNTSTVSRQVTPAPVAPAYQLSVDIDPTLRRMAVTGTATLPAATVPRSNLYFQLGTQMHDVRLTLVEPVEEAGELHPKVNGDNGLGSGYFAAPLALPIPPDVPIKVAFSYVGGDKTAFVFHIGRDGSYACASTFAWYPQFGPASFKPKFSVDGDENVTGKYVYSFPADMDMAAAGNASSPTVSGGRKQITYTVQHPSAGSFAVDHFRVLRSPGVIPITLYFRKQRPDEGQYLRGIRRVVDELTKMYGPFPFPEFGLVDLGDEAVRGAGFGGAGCAGFMLSTTGFLDMGFNLAYFGHEIGHQWWGNQVTHAGTDGNDLLDEAMAQYGSLQCVDRIEGPAMAEQYRRKGYPNYVPTQNGMQYLARHLSGVDHRLLDLPGDSLSHELADEKGFLVFDQLRREIGDAVFHEALHRITREYAFRSITWAEFCHIVESSAGRDLQWFWDQWYGQEGAPVLNLTWRMEGHSVVGVIRQTAPFYRIHVPVAVTCDDGSVKVERVEVLGAETPFHIPVDHDVASVHLDPNFELLHYDPETTQAAKAISVGH